MTTIDTERLVIRPWEDADAADALAIYGDEQVTHWLSPVMSRIPDVAAMRSLLQTWQEEVFAVVRPDNTRGAATAQRIGMEWIGETDKYHDLNLHLYRIRHYDLSYR